jgi:hypothetical protein
MPANETLEIFSGLGEIGLSIAALVVNQVHRAPCDASVLERLDRAVSDDEQGGDDLLFAEAVRRAEEEAGWARLNARQVGRLREATGTSTTVFPYLFREEFGAAEVLALAGVLRAEGAEDPA